MKKIYFDYFGSYINYALVVPAIIFITIYLVGFLNDNSSQLTKISAVLGHCLLALWFGKMFISQNYAGWNKKGMYLRIGYFQGNNLRFNSIRRIAFIDETLKVNRILEEEIALDLNDIRSEDAERLIHILKKNTPN